MLEPAVCGASRHRSRSVMLTASTVSARRDGGLVDIDARPGAAVHDPGNEEIARQLDELARVLEEQDADRFRVAAWRRAASSVRAFPEPLAATFQREGLPGIDRVPSVGPVIARAIQALIVTGHLPMLDRLRGESHPTSVLGSVPGIGVRLAQRLEREMGIHSLEELELAAHDGRLAHMAGFGPKRVRGVSDALAGRLGRTRSIPLPRATELSTAELLDVDREYRERASAGTLRLIAPRRFNPTHEAWLPILHTTRGDRHYTVLYSNTEQAHRLGKTRDWVVIYADGNDGERQCTVVTASRGRCAGQRVVRGRDDECEPPTEPVAVSGRR